MSASNRSSAALSAALLVPSNAYAHASFDKSEAAGLFLLLIFATIITYAFGRILHLRWSMVLSIINLVLVSVAACLLVVTFGWIPELGIVSLPVAFLLTVLLLYLILPAHFLILVGLSVYKLYKRGRLTK